MMLFPVWPQARVQRKSFLKLAFTSPDVISTSPKSFLTSRSLISQFFCYSNSLRDISCPSGKSKTEFTRPIANPLAPGYRTLLSLYAAWSQLEIRPIIVNWSLIPSLYPAGGNHWWVSSHFVIKSPDGSQTGILRNGIRSIPKQVYVLHYFEQYITFCVYSFHRNCNTLQSFSVRNVCK